MTNDKEKAIFDKYKGFKITNTLEETVDPFKCKLVNANETDPIYDNSFWCDNQNIYKKYSKLRPLTNLELISHLYENMIDNEYFYEIALKRGEDYANNILNFSKEYIEAFKDTTQDDAMGR